MHGLSCGGPGWFHGWLQVLIWLRWSGCHGVACSGDRCEGGSEVVSRNSLALVPSQCEARSNGVGTLWFNQCVSLRTHLRLVQVQPPRTHCQHVERRRHGRRGQCRVSRKVLLARVHVASDDTMCFKLFLVAVPHQIRLTNGMRAAVHTDISLLSRLGRVWREPLMVLCAAHFPR